MVVVMIVCYDGMRDGWVDVVVMVIVCDDGMRGGCGDGGNGMRGG